MGIDTPLPLSLFAAGEPELDRDAPFTRDELDERCWVDVAHRWVQGGDELLARLAQDLPWAQSRRMMWGNLVDEPRLTCGVDLDASTTPALLPQLAAALSARYGLEFLSCWCNHYRGGPDSVAWHSDRNGRTELDPYVAIVSLGGPRRFLMRPKAAERRRGTRARSWTLYSGDLLVMGGSCQHEWEHSVPKTQHAPPRMSVTFRHRPRAGRPADPSG